MSIANPTLVSSPSSTYQVILAATENADDAAGQDTERLDGGRPSASVRLVDPADRVRAPLAMTAGQASTSSSIIVAVSAVGGDNGNDKDGSRKNNLDDRATVDASPATGSSAPITDDAAPTVASQPESNGVEEKPKSRFKLSLRRSSSFGDNQEKAVDGGKRVDLLKRAFNNVKASFSKTGKPPADPATGDDAGPQVL